MSIFGHQSKGNIELQDPVPTGILIKVNYGNHYQQERRSPQATAEANSEAAKKINWGV